MNMKDNAAPVGVSVKWKDSLGKTAKTQGTPTFESDNPDAVAVVTDASGNTTVGPGPNVNTPDADENGVIATVQITATGDADLGDGVVPVTAVGSIILLAGDATTGEVTFAAPTP